MTKAEQIKHISSLEGQALKEEALRLLQRTFLMNDALKVSNKIVKGLRDLMTSEQLQAENLVLREQLSRLQQKLFGRSSERRVSDLWRETGDTEPATPQSSDAAPRDPASPASTDTASPSSPETSSSPDPTSPAPTDAPAPAPKKEKKPQHGHGPRPQPHLDTREERHTLPPCCCELCGKELRPTGLTDDSEEVTVVERRYVVIKHKRDVCRCPEGCTMKTAPAPQRWLRGGRYSLLFAVMVAINKYCYHLPLARQERMMASEGLDISRVTLWDLCDGIAELLKPAYTKLLALILGSDVISADETWWRLMEKALTLKWWIWTLTTHDAVWFHLDPSRGAKVLRSVLDGYEGVLLCDGYNVYETLAGQNPDFRLAHCWSHARRKFVEAEPAYPRECKVALDLIRELFMIEREVPDPALLEGEAKEAALKKLGDLRNTRSRKLVTDLETWMRAQKALPKSGLGQAISYALNRWEGLIRFLDDPLIPLHNNRTERAERGPVLGRKNHYGSRSERGTEVAAILYSLIETCRLVGVDPKVYLQKAVERALQDPANPLLPHDLARARPARS